MHKRLHNKADGRELFLFGTVPHTETPGPESAGPGQAAPPHMRWHPLRREWVGYSGSRNSRTFLPAKSDCPLCPQGAEIPFSDFGIAVFENRFPALSDAGEAPAFDRIQSMPARGRCEVVVYGPDHDASLSDLGEDRAALLLQVWADRIADLKARFGCQHVQPFENRGVEIGVTLHHPHGQIYGLHFVPPFILSEMHAMEDGNPVPGLFALSDLIVADYGPVCLIVPPYARFPYECWLVPRRAMDGPGDLTEAERDAMARGLVDAQVRLDGLFGQPMPYVMGVMAAPRLAEGAWHFTIRFQPFLRDAGKLKYLAGVEQFMGLMLNDVAPEEAAQKLRAVR